jgi:type I restriction enzyme, S subunit
MGHMSLLTRQGWRKGSLQDLVYFQRGFDITQAQQREGCYPVISSSGITSYHDEFKVNGPGVVIGRKGTLGSIHYTAEDYWPHDTTLWSKDLKGNNPRFVYYYLHTIDFKRFDVGNSNPTLNRNHIHGMSAAIPDLQTQKKIADLLSTFDNFIEGNRRRMALIDDAARLLYCEWFVRLRFPGHEHIRITNGLPEGWERLSIETVVKRVPAGKLFSQETAQPVGRIPILDQGRSGVIGYHDEEPSVEASEESPVIVFANHTCSQRMIFYPFSAIQNVLPYVPSANHFRNIFWLHYATDGQVKTNAYKGHWPELIAKNIVVPPRNIAEMFGDYVHENFLLCLILERQNKKLREARDLLLPRLMSGEMAV